MRLLTRARYEFRAWLLYDLTYNVSDVFAGFLLDMPENQSCQAVVELLTSRFLPNTRAAPLIMPPGPSAQPRGPHPPDPTLKPPTGPNLSLPVPPKAPPPTLWVSHVHDSVTEEALLAAFRRFGDISAHKMVRQSPGAFLEFKSHEAATKALEGMNGTKMAHHVSSL